MGHHEVGVVLLEIHRGRRVHDPATGRPTVKTATIPTAKSMGVGNRRAPPHMVASQLKILIPVGMAMIIVLATKKESAMGPSPTVNMWWLHTPHPMKPMRIPAYTTTGYPNRGFLEKVGMTSEMIPKDGRMRM